MSETQNLPEADLPLLESGAAALHLPLSPQQMSQFETFVRGLTVWNERMNLTAIIERGDVQTKHLLDSLVSLPLIAAEIGDQLPLQKPLRAIDVGTGAGFPGLPLQIVCPALQMTLMDGTQKKITFLQQMALEMGLDDVTTLCGRAEEIGRLPAHRERYDLVFARAVAPLATLIEYLLPLVAVGGMAVIYKGPGALQEFVDARKAIKTLGGDPVRLAPVEVPHLDEKRFVLLVKKIKPTPALYPRGQGLARKKPLL